MKIVTTIDINLYSYCSNFRALEVYDRAGSIRSIYRVYLEDNEPKVDKFQEYIYEKKKEIF
jgi:hypothetical protein